jgi:protein-S-isoprenylcysteine O-methyltransferase Ste14
MMRPATVIWSLWIAFTASWLLAAWWSNSTDKRLGLRRELFYRLLLLVGGLVLLIPAHGYQGPLRLWHVTRAQAWVCIVLIAGGFAFSWWARVHLGALWSGAIVRKSAHRVIDTGPYALVRHPIYTGILLAVYATATAKGTVPGVLGALIITLGLWMKAALEERWLSAELETGEYVRYRQRIPMLIPFGPRGT